ncbi:MAG: AbrB/MazE/SpoVT family DNA-binding domain-containing protein [Bryobacteraceae bacterium]|jgi:antitoxin MazE
MTRKTTVSKWGNNLAVRIPQDIVRRARIREGDRLTLDLQRDGAIVFRSTRPRYELSELVSRITPKNRHRETEWGAPLGKESY